MGILGAKNAAPLEKKPKKVNVDRVSYRQERIELSVVEFVQNLIVQDSDSQSADVVANIVEVRVCGCCCQCLSSETDDELTCC